MTVASLLAIDSSTEVLTLAVQGPRGVCGWQGPAGAPASAVLIDRARELLAQAGVQWLDLDGVAFGQGPGSFTGLRTACAVAQGLALGLDCPVVAVDSLLIAAEAARQAGCLDRAAGASDCLVVMDARMGEIYAARYRRAAEGWQVIDAPGLWAAQDLARGLSSYSAPTVATGTGLSLLPGSLGSTIEAVDPQAWLPLRAQALAALAHRLHAEGRTVTADFAHPLYLRDRVALTTAQRRAGAVGAGAR